MFKVPRLSCCLAAPVTPAKSLPRSGSGAGVRKVFVVQRSLDSGLHRNDDRGTPDGLFPWPRQGHIKNHENGPRSDRPLTRGVGGVTCFPKVSLVPVLWIPAATGQWASTRGTLRRSGHGIGRAVFMGLTSIRAPTLRRNGSPNQGLQSTRKNVRFHGAVSSAGTPTTKRWEHRRMLAEALST